MSELEVIFDKVSREILSTKMVGVEDTVIPDGYERKVVSYIPGTRKDLDTKIFDGEKFVVNAEYVRPISNLEKIDNASTLSELKDVLKSIISK